MTRPLRLLVENGHYHVTSRSWDRCPLFRDDEHLLEFLVRVASDAQPFHTLSGGNQQKVILARWLRLTPGLILLDEPTQGVDAGARAEIYRLVRTAVDAGASAIVVSSDPEELAKMADRVLVISGGRLSAELIAPAITAHRIVEASFGGTHPLEERERP